MNGTRRVRSEKIMEYQYIKRVCWYLKSKRIEWDEDINAGYVW